MINPLREKPGRNWHILPDGRIQCDLCPRYCKLHEGQRGLCFVRARQGDQMVLTTYGRSSGFCIDPMRGSIKDSTRPAWSKADVEAVMRKVPGVVSYTLVQSGEV